MRHAERITDSMPLPPWLKHEHEARYLFSREYVGGKVVLDCGSGEGKGSRSIAQGGPRKMMALDRSAAAVSLIRRGSARILPVNGSAERLPFRPKGIDVIVALEVIEHLDDPEAFLREIAGALRDDGTFICSTPNRLVRNPRAPLESQPLNPWHLREWSPGEFEALLKGAFTNVSTYGQSPQSRAVTRSFDLLGSLWRKGAAIARQLVKFRRLLWQERGIYEVRQFDESVDFEFLVCVCSAPRR